MSSLAAGNILGVLTWGYKLRNGPLRCDLFAIEATPLNAQKCLTVSGPQARTSRARSSPDRPGRTARGEGPGGAGAGPDRDE